MSAIIPRSSFCLSFICQESAIKVKTFDDRLTVFLRGFILVPQVVEVIIENRDLYCTLRPSFFFLF